MQKLIDDAYVEIGAAIEKLEFKDATEKAIYDRFRAVHHAPLKIWHCKNDSVTS